MNKIKTALIDWCFEFSFKKRLNPIEILTDFKKQFPKRFREENKTIPKGRVVKKKYEVIINFIDNSITIKFKNRKDLSDANWYISQTDFFEDKEK